MGRGRGGWRVGWRMTPYTHEWIPLPVLLRLHYQEAESSQMPGSGGNFPVQLSPFASEPGRWGHLSRQEIGASVCLSCFWRHLIFPSSLAVSQPLWVSVFHAVQDYTFSLPRLNFPDCLLLCTSVIPSIQQADLLRSMKSLLRCMAAWHPSCLFLAIKISPIF